MTTHLVLLSQQPPDGQMLIHELSQLLPDAVVDQSIPPIMQIRDQLGTLLLSIEAPSVVEIPGEAERLLNTPSPPCPYYWTELRSTHAAAEILQTLGELLAVQLLGELL